MAASFSRRNGRQVGGALDQAAGLGVAGAVGLAAATARRWRRARGRRPREHERAVPDEAPGAARQAVGGDDQRRLNKPPAMPPAMPQSSTAIQPRRTAAPPRSWPK